MRNTHLVEQFMKENGIKYNVPFTVKINCGDKVETKKLKINNFGTDSITLNIVGNTPPYEKYTLGWLIFSNNIKIVKEPWKPKKGEEYWYVCFSKRCDGWRVEDDIWDEYSDDYSRYIIGNCFKTKDEATDNGDDIFNVLQGEPLIKWEE